MADPTKWDWADSATGVIMGSLSAIVGMFAWFHQKLGKCHDRIDISNAAADLLRTSVRVLEADQKALSDRLTRIEKVCENTDRKQDEQIKLLLSIARNVS